MRLRLRDRPPVDYQVARDNHVWPDHMLRVQITAALLAWGRPVTVIDPAAGDGSIVAAAHKLHAIDGVYLSDISMPNFYRLGTELRDQFPPNNFKAACQTIEEALSGDDHFDAVVLTEILEHVEDPVAILKLARAKADMLIASSPVFLGDETLDPNPEHLWMFDADGYHEMLVESGWSEFAFLPMHLREFVYDFQIWAAR